MFKIISRALGVVGFGISFYLLSGLEYMMYFFGGVAALGFLIDVSEMGEGAKKHE